MKQLSPNIYIAWLYLILLALGCILAGWLFSVFHISSWMWLVTLAMILYLAKTGSDGIVLGNAWVMVIICLGVLFQRWPKQWLRKFQVSWIPSEEGTLPKSFLVWPIGYLVLWFFSITLILGLAFAHQPLRTLGLNSKQSFYSLVLLSWISLGIGMLTFKHNLFNFI